MRDLIKILEEHHEIMSQRGYDEIGLGTKSHIEDQGYDEMELRKIETQDYDENNSGTTEDRGRFMKTLEEVFSSYLRQSVYKKVNREFDVTGIGFFNDEKHLVSFQFHYELRAREGKIDLKAMRAEMQGVSKEFIFPGGLYELPHFSKVLAALLKEQEKRNCEPVHISEALEQEYNVINYKKTLTEHQSLLASKGYNNKEYFPYHEGFLFKKLEAKLSKRFWNADEEQGFIMRTDGFFNSQNDETRFSFHYTIDQNEKKLNLNALVAELHEARIVYPLTEMNDLPSAVNVWMQLTNGLKNGKAQLIYPKEKIKILLREQERFLGAFGYYKTFFSNDSNFIERELQGVLQQSLNDTELKAIPIHRTINLDLHDSMKCLFEYSFDPISVDLSLKSITAQVGVVEKKYCPGDPTASLTVQDIYKELEKQNRLLVARNICKEPTNLSGMKSLVKHVQKR